MNPTPPRMAMARAKAAQRWAGLRATGLEGQAPQAGTLGTPFTCGWSNPRDIARAKEKNIGNLG